MHRKVPLAVALVNNGRLEFLPLGRIAGPVLGILGV
jgi:hypothetical protein